MHYAVLEANAKVKRKSKNLHHPKPLYESGCRCKYTSTSTQGFYAQHLTWINSAVMTVHMR